MFYIVSIFLHGRDEADAEKFIQHAKELNLKYKLVCVCILYFKLLFFVCLFCSSKLLYLWQQVDSIDEKLMRSFSWACRGTFPPLVTAVGGLVAQEALISVTGKFTPLHQWVRDRSIAPVGKG